MESDNDFLDFMLQEKELVTTNRPLRLRLAHGGQISSDMLLPQRVFGTEAICAGLEYRILCVSARATLPLKEMIALPAALDFVTDRGELRSVCGIITEASSGDSDGGLASYQLVMHDALAIMKKRINTRVFRNMHEVEIVQLILNEWRQSNAVIASSFNHETDEFFDLHPYPRREFTMQYNESDAAFIRRLLKRRGVAWYFRADGGDGDTPSHVMVLFNNPDCVRASTAGTVRYHRDNPTEQRDTITAWSAVRVLQAGSVVRFSWDYLQPQASHFMKTEARGGADQGTSGNELAASLNDYHAQMPHAGADNEDLCRLGQTAMKHHDLETKCFHGEGSVRDLNVWEYFTLAEHPEIDTHPADERDFAVTALQVTAQNNLPKALAGKVERLFARNRWVQGLGDDAHHQIEMVDKVAGGPLRMHVHFTAVRRGVAVVPAFDSAGDLPQPKLLNGIVVGPAGEEVYCDQLGRVKVRFLAARPEDHVHAQGAGASATEADSAWVRVASNWAGSGPGSQQQCGTLGLPRVGSEVLIDFLGGDPDKPVIIGQMFNQQAQPPALSKRGDLPGNRYLSGIKSCEVQGQRGNQLCLDDTNGQISAQLASDHADSQLNLGWLTQPKSNGFGEPRGQGAELRSDKQVAVRGAEGVLISAHQGAGIQGLLLERAELCRIADGLSKLAEQLSSLATTHAADKENGPALAQLIERLDQWHEKGAPMVALSAPEGAVLGSGQNILLGAATDIDLLSLGATNLAAAGTISLRAAEGMSLFVNKGGLKLTVASGAVLVQTQDDQMELLARKVLKLISNTDWITIQAKQGVRINGGGTEIELSAAGIKGYTNGKHEMYAADHQTFPAKNKPLQFGEEVQHHDICIPCLLNAAKAHSPFAPPL